MSRWSRASTVWTPLPRTDDQAATGGHPEWCPADHRCTARWNSGGEHTSLPEAWHTGVGRLVATRHRSADTGRGHVELRIVVALPADEHTAQRFMRWLIAGVYAVLSKGIGPARR